MMPSNAAETLKVLITVKTYPIPSKKYDELVCTSGVTESGDFVRLYPINFREQPYGQQYRKYQWIKVQACKHGRQDPRKESYRPDPQTIEVLGEPIPSNPGNWAERAKYVLKKQAGSVEDLKEQQKADKVSLGIIRPKDIDDLVISPCDSEWKAEFLAALKQGRLFEKRQHTLIPLRKVPFKFQYKFRCDNPSCNGHTQMIEDWEVGALFWKLVDQGASHEEASVRVKNKFLNELCGSDKTPHFFMGTVLAHGTWVVLGVFYPKKTSSTQSLFES